MSDRPLFGGVETGGTKFVCVVGSGPDDVRAEERIPTTTPAETLARVVAFFRAAEASGLRCAAFGIAAFGPLDLDRRSPTWGHVTQTVKAGWSGADLVGPLREAFAKPVAIDTDVDGAGLAEARWGAARDTRCAVYLTVGTGIGGGVIVDGTPLRGLSHPEMGHLRVPRHPADDGFAGVCPFHGDCVEGLASGTAVRARWGAPLEELPSSHEAWGVLAWYLGHLAATVTLIVAPEVIVMGGGVMNSVTLLRATREWVSRLLAGYPSSRRLAAELDRYVVAPALGERSGALGGVALGELALAEGAR